MSLRLHWAEAALVLALFVEVQYLALLLLGAALLLGSLAEP